MALNAGACVSVQIKGILATPAHLAPLPAVLGLSGRPDAFPPRQGLSRLSPTRPEGLNKGIPPQMGRVVARPVCSCGRYLLKVSVGECYMMPN